MKPIQKGIPRAVEALFAFVGLAVLSPLLAVVALAVALLSSPGPILYRQKRVGFMGRTFLLYKFRSMRVSSSPLQVTAKDDDRVTAVGRVLRKTKIDELPELWNVLKGDMSLVGPRPEVERYVNNSSWLWREVLRTRPGITDPITLSLRNEEELLAQVSDDRERFYLESLQPYKLHGYVKYLRQRTPTRDVLVILRTLLVILLPSQESSKITGRLAKRKRSELENTNQPVTAENINFHTQHGQKQTANPHSPIRREAHS
jgi:lipopolysaccharide/colanic/teichoic acid biosynthesis glycosyltransferase